MWIWLAKKSSMVFDWMEQWRYVWVSIKASSVIWSINHFSEHIHIDARTRFIIHESANSEPGACFHVVLISSWAHKRIKVITSRLQYWRYLHYINAMNHSHTCSSIYCILHFHLDHTSRYHRRDIAWHGRRERNEVNYNNWFGKLFTKCTIKPTTIKDSFLNSSPSLPRARTASMQ